MSEKSDGEGLELLRATINFEHAALRPLPYLNGAAIIAALTFAGHERDIVDLETLQWALVVWTGGLLVSVVAIFFGYWSQYSFLKAMRRKRGAEKAEAANDTARARDQRHKHELWDRRGRWARTAAAISCLVSFVCFATGAFIGIQSLAT